MTENLLHNPNFEGGWTRATHTGVAYGEIFTPEGWTTFWNEGGDLGRPECKIIKREAPFLDPPRVYFGNQATQLFTFYRTHEAGYYQRVTGITPGALLEGGGFAHAWSSTGDDPHHSVNETADDRRNFSFQVGIDPTGGENPWADTVVWGEPAHIYDAYEQIPTVTVEAEGDAATFFVESSTLWPFKHNDAYFDAMWLTATDPQPQPTPDPDGWTVGREQYERTYVLMPPGCDDEWPIAAMRAGWDARRWTVGGSADDAGIGPEARTIIMVNPDQWDDPITAFFAEHYPGATLVEVYADSPADLENALTDYIHGDPIEPPVTPVPTPTPPVSGEPQYTLRSNNHIGLHSGFVRDKTWVYIEQSGTNVQKFFSAGDAYEAARRVPGIVSVWRKYVGNEKGRIFEQPTIRESAEWYIDQYAEEMATAARNMGLTLAQFLARPIALESLNETIGTHEPDTLQKVVEFDVHFADIAHDRWGDAVQTVLLCGAVGNPHESEVHYLLPAAEIAAEWGDFLGYHSYHARDKSRGYLQAHWPYHAGRWQEWDKVFRQSGVYPRYMSGEAGICFTLDHDGWAFDPASGWKRCGSFELYLADISQYNLNAIAWNAKNGNRFTGCTLFGYGNWGWDSFELGGGEVELLMDWAADGCPLYTPPAQALSMADNLMAVAQNEMREYTDRLALERDFNRYMRDRGALLSPEMQNPDALKDALYHARTRAW